MLMQIYMPLTYVLIAMYFTVRNSGLGRISIFKGMCYSLLANAVVLLSPDNLSVDNITVEGMATYLCRSSLTIIIMLVVLFFCHRLK